MGPREKAERGKRDRGRKIGESERETESLQEQERERQRKQRKREGGGRQKEKEKETWEFWQQILVSHAKCTFEVNQINMI